MNDVLKAIRFKNLDEARKALQAALDDSFVDVFDDAGNEPSGLLAVVPEDRLEEGFFYRLFGQDKGLLVEVERIPFSGFGPPADEFDYMGFESEQIAYVLKGTGYPIRIRNCSFGAIDFHHLDALVLDGVHPINREDLAARLDLPSDWDFDTLFGRVADGQITAQELDQMIHLGIQ